MGYSAWGLSELDMTEHLSTSHGSYLLLLPLLDKWDLEHPCQVKPGDLHCQAHWVSMEHQTAGGQGHWLC